MARRPITAAAAALPLGLLAAALGPGGPSPAADLPFAPPAYAPPDVRAEPWGGGGVRVPRIPLRPPPLRYDIYGYPLLPGLPSPLAAGGCPAAVQPAYDPDGNLAGYAPIPMCR